MPCIVVKKPFVLSFAPKRLDDKGELVPTTGTEIRFIAGEHDISDEIADHPYMKAGADGRIEPPSERIARLEAKAAQADEEAKLNARLLADAKVALARVKGNADPRGLNEPPKTAEALKAEADAAAAAATAKEAADKAAAEAAEKAKNKGNGK